MRKLIFIILLILIANQDNYAQDNNSILLGTVTDPDGRVIPNANITIISQSNSSKQMVVSDAEGSFVMILKPDIYKIIVEATNFQTFVINDINVLPKDKVSQDFVPSLLSITSRACEKEKPPPHIRQRLMHELPFLSCRH